MGSYQVSTPSFEAETADGKRRLTTVIARQVGQPGPGLVVVAHRDALGRGARAELSGTAAMIELARVVARRAPEAHGDLRLHQRRQRRAGRRARPRPAPRPGARARCSCSATSRGRRCAGRSWPAGRRATASARCSCAAPSRPRCARRPAPTRAARARRRSGRASPSRSRSASRARSWPPTCRPRCMSVGGERPPAAGDPIVRRAHAGASGAPPCARSPRWTTRRRSGPSGSTHALVTHAQGPAPVGRPAARRRPAAGADAGRRRRLRARAPPPRAGRPVGVVARRGGGAGRVALAFAWLLGVTGLLPATPPEPVAAGAIPVGTAGTVALVGHRAGGAPGLDRAAPRAAAQGRRRPRARFHGEGAGAALLVTWCALAAVLWLRNPYAAALLVPGAHALLAVVAPEVRLRRALAVALVVVAAAPFLLVDLSLARPARALAGGLRLVLRAARRRRRRRAAGLGHLEPRARLPGRRAARGAAQPLERGGAGDAADHRARPGRATRARARSAAPSRRCGDEARARHRARGGRAAGAGRRGATLAWQEPLSALRAARAQHHLAAQLHGSSCRARPRAGRSRPSVAAARARARALAPRRPGAWPSCASRASACARSSCAGPRRPTCARARASSPARRCPASAARRPSRGTARPTARRSATSTRCAAATRSLLRLPYAHLPLRGRGPADRRARDLSVSCAAWAMIGSCSPPVIRSFPPLVASWSSRGSQESDSRPAAGARHR